ncbi:HsdR family type I site-specific deoxyribonuclease [Xanthomonas arboricola]|uniref:type I restriction endonuclease subunit R n=1 Tax=Xanthomonas arboricola TaxID=56448 RepID=UPI00069D4092|nr:HsdR family type I site-specific deoxyribonuclease [Xanthomonas arboricola]KOA98474.1 DEAD/DEAH box helicase [Xanthomonas arboricola]KOB10163.1 DEAD/DEAH box helicase [Xanthomonas arboricola]KOB10946.1 DEAD/DEAH box helicase [Xanthomonas arboricola]KOB14680.1 DEAD/DEAH box helicase [Xanthomonas arboricola]KOB22770.1 DEAD/DEAH box helicase [Xanthomonas arboricola]
MNHSAPDTREQASAQLPALHLLCNLGWQYLSAADCLALRGGTREVLLLPRLLEVLQTRRFVYKGQAYPLSPGAIDQIVRELSALPLGEGLLAANEALYKRLALGITVTEFMPDGKKHQPTIAVIDWTDPAANRWDITEECEVLSAQGTHTRIPDIVGYVNGLPLVVIEAKRADAGHAGKSMVNEGISQQLRNQRSEEIPQLFAYAQLLLAISLTEARYGTTLTPSTFWARWRDEQFDQAHLSRIKNAALPAATRDALLAGKPAPLRAYCQALWAQPMLPTEQDRLLAGLLTPERLLEVLRNFVLFDRKVGKLVARYQQFFGIRALLAQLRKLRPDGGREGGVLWHTTGSGKSFTMVFLTKALLLDPALQECRVLVVTDRTDLETQLARNFLSGGAFGSAVATRKDGERSKATTGRDLAQRIGQGNERITFSLVQKFTTAAKLPECRNPSPNLIVLVDEGHRSHGGETHERMRKALPNAAYLAFTGTPLLKNEKTANKFGPILHAYSMQRAVEDQTVAPLLYEERVPELDVNEAAVTRWFDKITAGLSEAQSTDLKKKFAGKRAVYGAENRIELIAWDIAAHYHAHVKPLGLKGQVATDSKRDAIRYKRALDDTGLASSAVVISPPDTREGNSAVDEDTLPEVQKWWKQTIVDARIAPEDYERETVQAFGGEGDPDLLIVVDKLLTGFDEPRNGVLYIDKPLKGHNLIQAVARVNRLHDAKRHGLLVDYRGILTELDTAVRAYRDLETRTQAGFDVADLEGLYRAVGTEYKHLPVMHARLWAFFDGVANRRDLEQFRQRLIPHFVRGADGQDYDDRQALREDFYAALTDFGLCLQTALSSRSFFEDSAFPDALIDRYKQDLRFFSGLRLTARRDAMETVDYSIYEDQIRKLVDKHVIGREVREPQGAYVVHALGQPQDPQSWSDDKTRNEADLIQTRLRKTIEQDLAGDPYAQKVFGELLRQAIAEAEAMFDHPLEQYAVFKAFEQRLEAGQTPGIPAALADNRHASAYFGAIRLELGEQALNARTAEQMAELVALAIRIDEVVRTAVAEHSLNQHSIESQIRQTLLPPIFDLLGLDHAKALVEQVVHIARIGLSRA